MKRCACGLLAGYLLMTLTACSSAPAAPAATVQWGDYAAGMQARIDEAANKKDCAGLKKEFDAADKNNEATRARTGHSNTELMKYVDAASKQAGCYK